MTKKHSLFKNIRRLRSWRWRLMEQESSHCSSLDIDTPFLKVVDGSDQERDVLAVA